MGKNILIGGQFAWCLALSETPRHVVLAYNYICSISVTLLGLGPEGPFLGLTYFSEQQLVIQRLIIMLIDRHEKFYEISCPTLTSPSESSDSPYPL